MKNSVRWKRFLSVLLASFFLLPIFFPVSVRADETIVGDWDMISPVAPETPDPTYTDDWLEDGLFMAEVKDRLSHGTIKKSDLSELYDPTNPDAGTYEDNIEITITPDILKELIAALRNHYDNMDADTRSKWKLESFPDLAAFPNNAQQLLLTRYLLYKTSFGQKYSREQIYDYADNAIIAFSATDDVIEKLFGDNADKIMSIVKSTGKEIEQGDPSKLEKVVASILNFIFTPFRAVIEWFFEQITGDAVKRFTIDPQDNFFPLFAILGTGSATGYVTTNAGYTFIQAFKVAGISLVALNMIIGLYLCLIKEDNNGDNPVRILIRGAFACAAIEAWRPIMRFISEIFFSPDYKSGLISLFYVEDAQHINKGVLQSMVDTATRDQAPLAATIAAIILEVTLLVAFFRLFVEIIERWILCNIFYIASPMAFAMAPTKSTSEITTKFLKGYISQCLIMVLNIFFMEAAILMMNNFSNAFAEGATPPAVSGGNSIIYTIIILGFVHGATKIDNYLADLGLTAVRTGGGLATAMIAGVGTTLGMAKTVTRGAKSIGRTTEKGVDNVRSALGHENFAKRTVGRFTSKEGRNAAGVMNRAGNQRYGQKNFDAGVFGDASKGASFSSLENSKRPIGTIRGMDAANVLAANTAASIGGKDLKWIPGEDTHFDPKAGKGHGKAMLGNEVISGELTRTNSKGAINLGNGLYMKQDNGNPYIGKKLGADMPAGKAMDLNSYNAKNNNQFNHATMEALGIEKTNQSAVRKDHNGVFTLGEDTGRGYDTKVAMSYDPNAFGGKKLMDADNNPVLVNGNEVYGIKNPAYTWQHTQAEAEAFAKQLKSESGKNWVCRAAGDGVYKVESRDSEEYFTVAAPTGSRDEGDYRSFTTKGRTVATKLHHK